MSIKFGLVTIICVLATFAGTSESANILAIFTSHSPSHLIIHMSYVRALVERGHNVTVVTTIPLKDQNYNFHHIHIPISEATLERLKEKILQVSKSKNALKSVLLTISSLFDFGPPQFEVMKNKRFQDLMHNRDNKFDLLIVGYFLNDFQIGLGVHFNCPVIVSWMSTPNSFLNQYIGNPPEISYVPSSPFFGLKGLLTFKERLINFISTIIMKIFATAKDSQMNGFYNELFPEQPPLKEASKKISLILCNSHFSEGIIRPNVPALIEVGGIQIKQQPNPLPKHLQEIFDASSENGVIYISFGSNVEIKDFNPETFHIIYKVVADLKQTILWKSVGIENLGNSSNIHYQKWLPQDDILSQPNLKLFITHAGKGSVAESQYHGIPMVAIPLFGDQPGNADQLANAGFGVQLDHNTMSAETLRAAILEVIEKPKYRENVERFSTLYRDRPMPAKDTAVYWIEYVIRHKGAYHMQSPLVHLNSLQYIMLDVVAFLLLVVFLLYKLVTMLVTVLKRYKRGQKVKLN